MYTNDQGQVVASTMVNRSHGGGTQTDIAAPMPSGGLFVRSADGQKWAQAVDLLVAAGANDVHGALFPIRQTELARARLDDALHEELVNSWGPQAHQTGQQIDSGGDSVRDAENVVDEGELGEFWCANCDVTTHNMDRCVNMCFSDGSVDGCILCHDVGHDVDVCSTFMKMTVREKASLLVYDRGCLPPLRTERGWFAYLLDWLNCPEARDANGTLVLPFAFPWTPQFAKGLCVGSGPGSAVALQDEFDAHRDATLLPKDPATADIDRVWETYGQGHIRPPFQAPRRAADGRFDQPPARNPPADEPAARPHLAQAQAQPRPKAQPPRPQVVAPVFGQDFDHDMDTNEG